MPAPWNYLWMPGPYPKTEAERTAAALKYGMIPEDYKPFPDEGEGAGDYPDMGRCSGPDRPGNMWWDDEDLKVNVGQPIHHGMYLTKDGIGYDDTNTEDRNRNMTQEGSFLHTLKIVVPIVILYYLTWNLRTYAPVSDVQNPYIYANKDRKFYTFEKPE